MNNHLTHSLRTGHTAAYGQLKEMTSRSESLLTSIRSNQASECTKLHCLYGYFYLGIKVSTLAFLYGKSKATIYVWIQNWDQYQSVARRSGGVCARKYNDDKRMFILSIYQHYPTSYLDEVRAKFISEFRINISTSTIWRIIDEAGLTRKVIERRAIEISVKDIIRFCFDLLSLPHGWTYQNLVFLDEVGFDNRDMFRKHGYAMKGQRIHYRGEFTRKERSSLLCFLGVNGILDVYTTTGTFDRHKFISCCRSFALKSHIVQAYPASNSVWILDGASIHSDPNIVYYLRSLGIQIVFLPAYCPFFNPIEIVFGNVKSIMQRYYHEKCSLQEMKIFIAKTLFRFKCKNMRNIFKKCGYIGSGIFNSGIAFHHDSERLGFEETN